MALTLVIFPTTETGTVPPLFGTFTVPVMLRPMSTVPVPLPTGVVKVMAPLLIAI